MASIITADNGTVSGSAGLRSSADNSGVLQFAIGAGTTATTIDASGNVGIGTTAPGALIDLQGTQTFSMLVRRFGAAANTGLGRSNGTQASPIVVSNGDVLHQISFQGYDGLSAYQNAARISAVINGATIGSSSMPGALTFGTTPSGSVVVSERMRIDSSGNVGIGTSTPGQTLEVNGNVFVNTASGNPYIQVKTGGAGNNPGLNLTASSNTWTVLGTFSNTNTPLLFQYNNTTLMNLDSLGNLGLQITPNSWFSNRAALQFGNAVGAISASNGFEYGLNFYVAQTTAVDKYMQNGYAVKMHSDAGVGSIVFSTAGNNVSGGGANITWSERVRINNAGNLGIGTTSPNYPLNVTGSIGLTAAGNSRLLATGSQWGYSSGYRTIILGSASSTYTTDISGAVTLCFGVDVSGNSSGSFTGDGRELVFRNVASFVTPNSGNTGYLTPLSFNNGNVGIGASVTNTSGRTVLGQSGSIIQTVYTSSGTRTSVDSTSFTEASSSYRVTITPSNASTHIMLHYFIPMNCGGSWAANTIFSIRAWRSTDGGTTRTYTGLTSSGVANGSRNPFAGITFRPNNGYDGNDPGTQSFIVYDVPTTTSACTYGFEFKRETGGGGTLYFGQSQGDSSNWGFDTNITIVAQEIAR